LIIKVNLLRFDDWILNVNMFVNIPTSEKYIISELIYGPIMPMFCQTRRSVTCQWKTKTDACSAPL
jgi:hypothetical protein